MTHSVDVEELQAHLSEYLRKVEEGDTIIVRSAARTIAKIVPDIEWVQPPDPRGLKDLDLRTIPPLNVDPVALLIADREKDRNR